MIDYENLPTSRNPFTMLHCMTQRSLRSLDVSKARFFMLKYPQDFKSECHRDLNES